MLSYSAVPLSLVSLGEFCFVFIKQNNQLYWILVTYTYRVSETSVRAL